MSQELLKKLKKDFPTNSHVTEKMLSEKGWTQLEIYSLIDHFKTNLPEKLIRIGDCPTCGSRFSLEFSYKECSFDDLMFNCDDCCYGYFGNESISIGSFL